MLIDLGDYVQRGTILTTQIHKFRFYPGSFVSKPVTYLICCVFYRSLTAC